MEKTSIHQLIEQHAHEIFEQVVAHREHLHANPELSFQEFETAKYVSDELTKLNISHQTGVAGTGVVAIIRGDHHSENDSCIGLRADLDALPIQEENDIPYKSKVDGVMHACGHDVHTSILLGVAYVLNQLRNHLPHPVKLIFQPGEEKNPGGASYMIKEGVLQNPAPQKIFALHVHPGLEVGEFSFRGGMVMASADEIYISIKSKGGHAAAPQFTADTILIASHLIVSLQQIISRNNNPFNPSVLSITSFQAGNTTNVIPSEVKLMGTFRAMDEEWRFKAHELITKQTIELVAAMGAEASIHIDVGYPFVLNNEALCAAAMKNAAAYAGNANVTETELRMGAEDFAYYSHQIPACFFRLGVGNKALGITSGVHTPSFNVDERCIEQGIGMMAWMAVSS